MVMFRGQTVLAAFFEAGRAPFLQCHILPIQGRRLKYKGIENTLTFNRKIHFKLKLEYPNSSYLTCNCTYVAKHTSRSI